MILNANNKDHHKYMVFDADNNELKYLVGADTETGLIERLLFDDNGKPKIDEDGNVLTEVTNVPAPLKLVDMTKANNE